MRECPIENDISVAALKASEVSTISPAVVVIGLGFEERTAKSVHELVDIIRPCKVLAIQYRELGKSEEILQP